MGTLIRHCLKGLIDQQQYLQHPKPRRNHLPYISSYNAFPFQLCPEVWMADVWVHHRSIPDRRKNRG